MVSEGPGGAGTRIIARRYPVTSGLTAGTTKTEGRQINLVPEIESHVRDCDRIGTE